MKTTSPDRPSFRPDIVIPFLTVLFDSLAIEAAFLISYWLRFKSPFFASLGFTEADTPPFRGYVLGSLAVTVVWLLLFNARKMYRTRRSVNLADELINVVKVVSLGMLIVMSAAFFYREFSYSRVVFGLLWGISIPLIIAGRAAVQWLERRSYRKGLHLKKAVIIGGESTAGEIHERLHHHPSFGFSIVGYFHDSPAQTAPGLSGATYLGNIAAAADAVRSLGIETVFIAVRAEDHGAVQEFVAGCEGVNMEFLLVPDVLEMLASHMKLEEIDGIPFLKVKSIPFTLWGRVAKRALDGTVAATAILLLSPLWLTIMLLIRLTSHGPVIFKQKRVGLDGRSFTMYKFRSMKIGSDREDHTAGLGISDDPRRTTIGVFLRKTSLDELPQFFNVLRGDMSLVGPRPERVQFVEQYRHKVPKYYDRHRVKTGITGWAQVNGLRGNTSIEDRIRYDLYYIENWSFAFDIKILLRTLRSLIHPQETH